MTDHDTAIEAAVVTLDGLGFTDGDIAGFQALAAERGMSDNGPYVVHCVKVKDGITALIEQTTVASGDGAMTYPPVLVLEGPKGRVAVSHLEDAELIASMVTELA